jgi:phosphoribosyl 1,2-cyclic phosphate phosphodiesterase
MASSLTILGCGTSTGVPIVGCRCKVCKSRNPKNRRLRASVWVQSRGKSLLIDTATDLRSQALRHKIFHVDAVLYTHPHADHVGGIDELRTYNFLQKADLPVYGNAWTMDELTSRFPYIFKPTGIVEGGGIPQLIPNLIKSQPGSPETIEIAGIPVTPIPVSHGSQECLGFRFDSVAYVTDCSYIPPSSFDRLKGLSVLVLDCLRIEKHGTHFNLDQALETVRQLRPKKAILTHLGHDFDYQPWVRRLGREFKGSTQVTLAYDGLTVRWR